MLRPTPLLILTLALNANSSKVVNLVLKADTNANTNTGVKAVFN